MGEAVMRSERHESLRGSRDPLPADPVSLLRREYVPELLENFRFCRSGTTSNAPAYREGVGQRSLSPARSRNSFMGNKKKGRRSSDGEANQVNWRFLPGPRLIASLRQTNGESFDFARYRIPAGHLFKRLDSYVLRTFS